MKIEDPIGGVVAGTVKNYGVDLDKELREHTDKDWTFGGITDGLKGLVESIAENIEAIKFLPTGEVQRGREDMMDCASRGPNNIIEDKLNYWYKTQMSLDNIQWLNDNGYIDENGNVALSDAFTAILSGTGPNGNSLKAPLEAIKDYGCVPKKLLPFDPGMTQSQYLNKKRITSELKGLGQEFKRRFPINFIRYNKKDFDNIDKYDSIDIALYAWPEPVNGIYPRMDGAFNHCVMLIAQAVRHTIFDNYLDFDQDFIKRLAEDYDFFDYGYRILINEQVFSFELTTEMAQFIYLLREDVRKEFSASNGFYSIYDPTKKYNIYDWCRRYGFKENPEVFLENKLDWSRINVSNEIRKEAEQIPEKKTLFETIIQWLKDLFAF